MDLGHAAKGTNEDHEPEHNHSTPAASVIPVVEDGRIVGVVSRGDFKGMEIDRLDGVLPPPEAG